MKVTWLPFGYSNPEELENLERYAYRKFYLRPKYIFKKIWKTRSFSDLVRYFKGAVALVKGSYIIPFGKKKSL